MRAVQAAYVGSFGFLANGSYSFEFNPISTDNENYTINLGFLTKKEYRSIPFYDHKAAIDCANHQSDLNFTIELSNKTVKLEGTIPDEHIYIFRIIKCDFPNSFSFTERFRNKHTLLDSREIPCSIIYPICIGLILQLLAAWILYNAKKNRTKGGVFVFTSACIVVYTLHLVAEYIAFKISERSDSSPVGIILTRIIDVLNDSVFFTAIIFISSGYGLINVQLSLFMKLKAIFLPLLMFSFATVAGFLPSYMSMIAYPVVLLFGLIIGFDVYRLINGAEKRVLAHMLIVQRTGIDPETTPIGARYKIFHQMMLYIAAALGVFCIMLVLEACLDFDRYLFELIDFSVHYSLLAALLIIYRPGRADFLADESQNPAETFDLDDLDTVGDTLRLNSASSTMRRWEPGEALPREPTYTTKKKSTGGQLYSAL